MDDTETGVLTILSRFTSKRATLATEIYHDLRIYGDDADELLTDINKKYSTSFEGLKFNSYFPNEIEALPRIARLFGMKDKLYGSCTIGHLAEVVRRGKWFDPT